MKKTLVLGASENPTRYSYLAVNSLVRHGHSVRAIGMKKGSIASVIIEDHPIPIEDVDTVSLYLNPKNQEPYYDYIIGLKPKRVIFNPGTENPELVRKLRENHIEPEAACTLVLLSTGQY